jgi:hypothetical protein
MMHGMLNIKKKTKNAVKWQLVVMTNMHRKIVTLKTIPTDAVKAFITGINESFQFSYHFHIKYSLSLSPVSSYMQ